jgi:molybdate transport system ATP-binding protein
MNDAADTAYPAATVDALRIRLRMPRADFLLDVDLHLSGRGITVLFGPSGSGKTSLLRAVAGLDRPRAALVRLGRDTWQDDEQGTWVPTHQRPLGVVFQEASLFDHLDVMGNLRFGLVRSARSGRGEAALREGLEQAVAHLGIDHLLQRRTHTLSAGGHRTRTGHRPAAAVAG